MPYFSILIVLYFSKLDIVKKNLKKLSHDGVECVLVDNSESPEYFRKVEKFVEEIQGDFHGEILLIRATTNKGYTGGNNLAFRYSKGTNILILNPDMELGPNFLFRAEIILEKTNWGILGPVVVFCKPPNRIQNRFILFKKYSPWNMFTNPGFFEDVETFSDKPMNTFNVCGGCFIIRRDLFRLLRGFDENYFMYTEETDLCYRAQVMGEKVVYCPDLLAIHHHEIEPSIFSESFMFRNNLVFFGKFFSIQLLLIQALFSILRIFIVSFERIKFRLKYQYILPLLKQIFLGTVLGLKNHLNTEMRGKQTSFKKK